MTRALFLLPLVVGLPMTLAACSENKFHEAKSPNGELTASLNRPSGSMAPIFYSVVVRWGSGGKQRCELANMQGYEVERFTRVSWRDDRTVEFRYGVPSQPVVDDLMPKVTTGERKCRDYAVVLIPDPSLNAAADAVVKKYGSDSGPVDDRPEIGNLTTDDEPPMVPDNQTVANNVIGNAE